MTRTAEQKANLIKFAEELETTTAKQCQGLFFYDGGCCAMGVAFQLIGYGYNDIMGDCRVLDRKIELKEHYGLDEFEFGAIVRQNDVLHKTFKEIAVHVRELANAD